MKGLKQLLEAAAMSRKQYLSAVDGIAPTILEHVLLLHMYPDAREQKHWKGEIRGNLRRLFQKLKSGSKPSTKRSILYDYLVDQMYDRFTDDMHMSGLVYAMAADKSDLTLTLSHVDMWKSIKPRIIVFYDTVIDYIVADDIKGLIDFINKY